MAGIRDMMSGIRRLLPAASRYRYEGELRELWRDRNAEGAREKIRDHVEQLRRIHEDEEAEAEQGASESGS